MPRIKSDEARRNGKAGADKATGTAAKSAGRPGAAPAAKPKIAALIWYEPEHYPRAIKAMSDRHTFPTTYEGWAGPARAKERARRAEGWQVIRVPLDPTVFRAWCADHGLKRDAQARKAYARDGAQQRLREQRAKAS